MRIARIAKREGQGLVRLEGGRAYAWDGDIFGPSPRPGRDLGAWEALPLSFPIRPGKIIGLGANYAVDGEKKKPFVFLKPVSSLDCPGATFANPHAGLGIVGEPELAFVIRKRIGPGTRMERPEEFILGYTLLNDITLQGVSAREEALLMAKGSDSFCPIAPWIETEFRPGNQAVQGILNGIPDRVGRLSNRVMAERDILAHLSEWMTLEPGDLVTTGAPRPVNGFNQLKPGDEYTVAIDGLGRFTARCVESLRIPAEAA